MSHIIIIGAGPAGSMAAALLRKQGVDVLILEKQTFPRFSIGESLLAQSLALIDEAGMLEAVQSAGFQYKNGAAFVRGARYADYNFADKSTAGPGYTFQVPRADFDHLLAKEAEALGARIEFGSEIVGGDFSGSIPVLFSKSADGKQTEHRPDFVLDASGFGRTLPRLLNLEEPSNFPVRSALFTQVHDAIPSGTFDRQKIRIIVHPQKTDVWYWLIPFSDGRASVGVVAADEIIQQVPGTPAERFRALVDEDPDLAALLSHASPALPVGELRGFSANVKQMHGPGFALLGNAAEFLDPVFSSGVTIAMKSASLACNVLSRQFNGDAVDWEQDFAEPLRLGVETFRNFVSHWYDGSLQDVFFFENQDPQVRRHICAILAGYAWDPANPFVGPAGAKRIQKLAKYCRGMEDLDRQERSQSAAK